MKSKLTIKSNMPQLEKNMKELEKKPMQVTLDESINPEFLSRCPSFTSLDDMLSKSGFKIETAEDFAAIPDHEWDKFISAHTTYDNWHDLQVAALTEIAKKRFDEQLTKGFKKL
ncbi:hypothetical protein [Yersinia aldovae]|uniref:hypothetical protein n=1 Tax=Yersinia aldovae TaxID=29483 RepID=UPI0016438B45|nr:hypothetical protein [Yersinia aldovae]